MGVQRFYNVAQLMMGTLNINGAKLLKKYKARACTDVTGFGLQGHSNFLAKAQTNKVDFRIHALPLIKNCLKLDKVARDFKLTQGLSAETSGGLFICLSKENAKQFVQEMRDLGEIANIIGEVVSGKNKSIIDPKPEIIEIG
eukprot:TRINITY_DN4584_c0_g1_i4.p2 TRINITY_DN4584_c0_g1~~TRINITY_DN4584_c0_g1_i4.p2  ORF type:complete len:142 (-),score=27.41 TRINITY_DN4584_c0_g1_i4:223-648(-)